MKFISSIALALLAASTEATSLNAMRHHHHHLHSHEYVSTLPDVRDETVADADIASHESARAEAAKVKKNPQASLIASVKADLEQINKDMSFGVSFSQTKRNDHARELTTKVASAIKDYSSKLLAKVESGPNETLTEQNAHNIASIIFFDVQLQDAQKGLGLPVDGELVLAVNRLKSLQKLYLFEQKGGENYLG
eukprot:CAMPEP_0170490522 /NCGR_PEP_ID=MMETSP0208-20121228/8686_1 /TAXON_ID=197538 /ORGANISM="Strombidium inclinatum, Strain S3" /LENGTH=193 /DNA_ID=CAMNT_0010765917 /DNA_START=48 /DNA_END=629 /DNA_ORIENTATION=+